MAICNFLEEACNDFAIFLSDGYVQVVHFSMLCVFFKFIVRMQVRSNFRIPRTLKQPQLKVWIHLDCSRDPTCIWIQVTCGYRSVC